MSVLVASIAEMSGLECEDPLGSGYLAAHLDGATMVDSVGFVDPASYERLLLELQPELTFLGSFSANSPTLNDVLAVALSYGQEVIVGGPGFAAPHDTPLVHHPAVLRVVFGEADAIEAEALLDGTPHESISSSAGGRASRPAALASVDHAPFPRRPRLEAGKVASARLTTARGCPFGCRYCPVPVARRLSGLGWRPRSPSSLEPEVDHLARLGATHVSLADESATGPEGLPRMHELAELFEPTALTWSAMIAPSALDGLDREAAQSWARSGLTRAYLLLNTQTGLRDNVLDLGARSVIRSLQEEGVDVDPGIITVDPYVTAEQLLDRFVTIARLVPSSAEAYMRPLSVHPGTPELRIYERTRPAYPAGPRARRRGVQFCFVHRATSTMLEELLKTLDDLEDVDSAARSAAILRRVRRLRANGTR